MVVRKSTPRHPSSPGAYREPRRSRRVLLLTLVAVVVVGLVAANELGALSRFDLGGRSTVVLDSSAPTVTPTSAPSQIAEPTPSATKTAKPKPRPTPKKVAKPKPVVKKPRPKPTKKPKPAAKPMPPYEDCVGRQPAANSPYRFSARLTRVEPRPFGNKQWRYVVSMAVCPRKGTTSNELRVVPKVTAYRGDVIVGYVMEDHTINSAGATIHMRVSATKPPSGLPTTLMFGVADIKRDRPISPIRSVPINRFR